MTGPSKSNETAIWTAYPSWGQFAWLYFISLLAGFRGLLYLLFDVAGWEGWVSGAAALLVCAALLRRWARYSLTSSRVVVSNGYTGREIQAVALDAIEEITVRQGPVARLLGIGTIVIRSLRGERILRLRGIKDPESIKGRIQGMRPAVGSRAADRASPP